MSEQANMLSVLSSNKAPKTKWEHLKHIIIEFSTNVSDEVAQDAYMVILGEMHRLEGALDDALIESMIHQLNEFNQRMIVKLTEENRRKDAENQRLRRELYKSQLQVIKNDNPIGS